ncbi:hypothetical protein P2318_24925 [Myxococcaceae bacterium GXIMD 01537]
MTGWGKKFLFGVMALGLTSCGGTETEPETMDEQALATEQTAGASEEASSLSRSHCPRAFQVDDIFRGESSPGIAELTDVDGTLFFIADDGEHGVELWKSDGTARGTKLVKDILRGPEGSFPRELTAVGDTLFFAVGAELWKSDGTARGTERLATFFVRDGSGAAPRALTEVRGKLYFTGDTEEAGAEPWVSDGTRPGTRLVADVVAGTGGSNPRSFIEFKGDVVYNGIFTSDEIDFGALYRIDHRNRVSLIDTISDEASFTELLAVGNKLFTLINDEGDVRLDVTTGGPLQHLAFFRPNAARHLTEFHGKAFFAVGMELWRSDGTEAGTRVVRAIGPANSHPGLEFLTVLRDRLYFSADDGVSGRELWVSNGSESGTKLFADINPGPASSSPSDLLAVHNSKLYFTADDGVHGREPWKLHAGEKEPELLKDIARGPASSSPRGFTRSGDLVFFAADDGIDGEELWATFKEHHRCR